MVPRLNSFLKGAITDPLSITFSGLVAQVRKAFDKANRCATRYDQDEATNLTRNRLPFKVILFRGQWNRSSRSGPLTTEHSQGPSEYGKTMAPLSIRAIGPCHHGSGLNHQH